MRDLCASLSSYDVEEARDLVRSLADLITLVLEGGRLRVEVRGKLAEILRLSGGPNAKILGDNAEALRGQIKKVAERRY